MPLATLTDVLRPAMAEGRAVVGAVCLGWEDMRAFARAAEEEGLPIILQAGPSCRAHTPLPVLGAMMRHLAEASSVPIVVHLDHGASPDECRAAIDAGFTSVMYDGSRLLFADNARITAECVRLAHEAGVSCEGEIGFVGYDGGAASEGTDPDEAGRFAAETGIDALAVSVGNVHLQQREGAALDEDRLTAIAARTDVPLVIHGGSGVPREQRPRLARGPVGKVNIGTELRRVFGAALRDALADPERFDRVEILRAVEAPLTRATRAVLRDFA